MGTATDRFLAACLLVVRLLTAVAAVVVASGIAYVLFRPKPGLGGAVELEVPRQAATPEVLPPVTPPAVAPVVPVGMKGTTRLVRRLEIGEELRVLRAEVARDGAEGARFEERYRRVAPLLLAADGPLPDDPSDLLRQLTEPPRDLTRLMLAGAAKNDPLGGKLRVRVWTIGEPYPAEEMERVSWTMEHVVRCAGRAVPGGIDVLVTPRTGHDVFPFQRGVPWAAGIYFLKDRYCVARAGLSRRTRPEVVEHECIHALCWSIPSFPSSRFVAEGVAEYLRLVGKSDWRLRIPRDRFADQCAAFDLILRNLEAAGVPVGAIDPQRLVDLSPRDLYALRHFSYLVAQLSMAYVGGDVIENALAAGSDGAIVLAVRAIAWPDFLEWVRAEAQDGRPGDAVIVEDGVIEDKPLPRDAAAMADALRAIGADWPAGRDTPDPAILRAGLPGMLGTEERIVEAFHSLFDDAATGRVYLLCSELSSERLISVPRLPNAIEAALGDTPEGDTPRRVADSLNKILNGGLARTRRIVRVTARSSLGFGEIPRLVERDQPVSLVFVVDTGGADDALRLDWPADCPPPPVVIVVDISEDGEAAEVATKYDRAETLVAYWRLRLK